MNNERKLRRVGRLLLAMREKEVWPWLTDRPGRAGLVRANKFFAGSIVDYQTDADFVWKRVKERIETDLRDPRHLWNKIVATPRRRWRAQWKTKPWHKFPKGHERVWRIGKDLVRRYHGDVRNVWRGQSPAEVYSRLMNMRVGPQISRMVIGALMDAREIRGTADVKADIHVKRVVGRIVVGREVSEQDATMLTRAMHPRNPWRLDASLFYLGKYTCTKRKPGCAECSLTSVCTFWKKRRAPH